MTPQTTRRRFLAASGALGISTLVSKTATAEPSTALKIGVIGLGGRGRAQIGNCFQLGDVTVPAVCDVAPDALARAQAVFKQYQQPVPEAYTGGPDDYKRLLAREDLDAVIISTPWEWHARMAVDAMKAGKYVGVETPLGLTVDELWEVVKTSEETGCHCMMFENWSFRQDNLALLNMVRAGLFGDIVHAHCSYSHNCIHWFFDPQGEPRWSGRHLIDKNAAQYCTHGMGPIPGWMNLNREDRIDFLVATATKPLGIQDQLARKHGPDHAWAKQEYKQGDIVTAIARTVQGKTIVINNDVVLPRPYDNRWTLQGTRGIYNEQRGAVYLEGVSPAGHQWEPFAPYEAKYNHRFWEGIDPAKAGGHGGTDYVVMKEFLNAVRRKETPPLDIYDSAVISVINPLSGESIANGSQPVKCPDFTQGAWETNQASFGV